MLHRHIYRPRTTTLVAAGLVAIVSLSGCGRSGSAEPSEPSESPVAIDDSPATGTVTVWAPSGDADTLDEVLTAYKARNADLTIDLTIIPDAEYNTKLQTAIAAGSQPDVSFVYLEGQSQFTGTGAFSSVPDDLVDENIFFPGAWSAGEVDGVTYSVPWYVYTRTLMFRSDLAEDAGVTAPETWGDMIPFATALQDAGAEYGIGVDVGYDTYTGQALATLALSSGAQFTNADGTEWDLDSPEMLAATEYYSSFYSSGVSSPDGPQFMDQQPWLIDGKVGALLSGPWVINQLDATAGEVGWAADHISTALLPAGDSGSIGQIAGGSWAVSSTSKNSDSAWKLVREITDTEVQVAQYKANGSLPAVSAAWEDPAIADQPLLDAFFTQLESAQPLPQETTWSQVTTIMGTEFERAARGDATPAEVLEAIQSQAESLGLGN